MDQSEVVIELVRMRRRMDDSEKRKFDAQVDAYFQAVLERTAKNVRGNYDKKIRHTMSALGWCHGLSYDCDKHILSLRGN